jgi:Rieske Fe-S protein
MNKSDKENVPDKSRRSFVLAIPFAVAAGTISTLGIAAFRFLRPRVSALGAKWLDVGQAPEIVGPAPVTARVAMPRDTGWAATTENRSIFLLPGNKVLSAICPHEGCEVSWEQERNRFSCPCHESYFAADGSRISGPANRGLEVLPSRIVEGTLQVQYHDSPTDHS